MKARPQMQTLPPLVAVWQAISFCTMPLIQTIKPGL